MRQEIGNVDALVGHQLAVADHDPVPTDLRRGPVSGDGAEPGGSGERSAMLNGIPDDRRGERVLGLAFDTGHEREEPRRVPLRDYRHR